jgi:ABC-2 type transport system permease protein
MSSLILTIVRKECVTTWRSGAFRWLSGILLLLVVAASIAGVVNHARRHAAEAWASDTQRDQWLHKTIVNSHVAAHAGTMLFRPQHPLSVVDVGVDPVVGMSVFLERIAARSLRIRPPKRRQTRGEPRT